MQRLRGLMAGLRPPHQAPHTRLLFVCTGNICRSPCGEAVMRARLAEAGRSRAISVASAGTHAMRGSAPDARATRAAKERGYDLSAIRARQFVVEDFSRFDRILVMDEGHAEWLRSQSSAPIPASIEMLMTHARRHADVLEVPDPYYGAPEGFQIALDLIEDACDGLLLALKAEGNLPDESPQGVTRAS